MNINYLLILHSVEGTQYCVELKNCEITGKTDFLFGELIKA